MRACWTGTPRGAAAAGPWAPAEVAEERVAVGVALTREVRRPRTFVPVDELEAAGQGTPDGTVDRPAVVPSPVTRVPGTWWLWGDPEPWPET
jgi:hypothetical protein